jgi:hypothetical protein
MRAGDAATIAPMDSSAPRPRAARRELGQSRTRLGLALIVFVAATVFWFAPLIGSLGSKLLDQPGSGDAANYVRNAWAIQQSGSTPFTFSRDKWNGAPEGIPQTTAIPVLSPVQPLFTWVLTPALGLVGSLNLFLLLGFPATAFAAFLFLDWLGFGFLPSLFGAYVIAFNPWTFNQALAGAPAFEHGWCLILLMWSLVRLQRSGTVRAAALAGLCYATCFLVAAYFGLIASAIVTAYIAVALVRDWSRTAIVDLLKRIGVMAAVTAVPLVPAVVVFGTEYSTAARQLNNPVGDAIRRAVDPFASYLVPSPHHPFLGFLSHASLSSEAPTADKVYFFGYTTLALAAVGLFMLMRSQRVGRSRARDALLLAAACLPIAYVSSLPQHVHLFGLAIPTTSWLVTHVTSFYRVYARFGFVVGISLAVLAASALAALARRPRGSLLVAALAAVMVFELLPGRVSPSAADTAPAYDHWLATQPSGIVAHYPMPTDNELALRLAGAEYHNTRFTGQPLFTLFGAGIGGTREEGIRLLARDLTGRLTPRILSAEGVRYVVIHDDIYRQLHIDPPPLGAPFHRVATFGAVRIYRQTPHPDPHLIDKLLIANAATLATLEGLPLGTVTVGPGGFNEPERYHHVFGWHWMTQNGTLQIDNPYDHPMKFRLTGHAFSNGVPRTVEIQSDTGKKITTFHVAIYETGLRVQPFMLEPGVTTLNLFTTPGPQDLGAARMGSIFLSPVRAVPLSQVSLRAS